MSTITFSLGYFLILFNSLSCHGVLFFMDFFLNVSILKYFYASVRLV